MQTAMLWTQEEEVLDILALIALILMLQLYTLTFLPFLFQQIFHGLENTSWFQTKIASLSTVHFPVPSSYLCPARYYFPPGVARS